MTDTQIATVAPARVRVEHPQALFDTDRFEQFQRVASALRYSSLLSESIRGDGPEQCFSNLMIVCEMAERWKMSPSALGQSMSIIHGKVCVEGKAIQAALDSTLGIELYPWWVGERGSDEYRIFLSDHPWDDMDDTDLENLKAGLQIKGRRIVDGSVGEWKTTYKPKDSQRWETKPAWVGAASQDQLLYRATRQWTRRFKPSLIMGVYADDEIEAIEERRERRTSTAITAAPITAGFTTKAAEEDHVPDTGKMVEDAVIEEVSEPAGWPQGGREILSNIYGIVKKGGAWDRDEVWPVSFVDAARKVSEAARSGVPFENIIVKLPEIEDSAPSGEERTEILNAAFDAARQGLAFPVNMAWGDAIIAEIEEATERGRVQRWGDIEDGIVSAVITGQVPSYEGITDDILDKVKAGISAIHDFREEAIKAARAGSILERILDLDEDAPLILNYAYGTMSIPPQALDVFVEELEAIIATLPTMAEETASKEAVQEPADETGADTEDLADAGSAADPWRTRLESCSAWVEVKTAFVQLTKTEQWAAFDEEEQNRLRAITWERQQAINDAGDERLDMITDFTAFRCWIEYATDPDAIEGNWQALTGLPAWESAAVKIRDALVPAVRDRIRALK